MMRIMEVNKYGNSIWYRTACACDEPNHDWTLELSYDEELDDIILTIYCKTVYASWVVPEGRIAQFKKRLKDGIRIICGKPIEFESEGILMDKPEQLQSFIDALNEGIKFISSTKEREVVDGK